jgi:hypothetical protein
MIIIHPNGDIGTYTGTVTSDLQNSFVFILFYFLLFKEAFVIAFSFFLFFWVLDSQKRNICTCKGNRVKSS